MGMFPKNRPVSSASLVLAIIWMGLLFNEGESRAEGLIKGNGKDFLKIRKATPLSSQGIESENKSGCSSVSWSVVNCILGPLSPGNDFPPSVFPRICPEPYGKFKVHESCHLFANCHNGSFTLNRCPASTFFDASKQDCRSSSDLNNCSRTDEWADIQFITNLTKSEDPRLEMSRNSLEEFHPARNNETGTGDNVGTNPPEKNEDKEGETSGITLSKTFSQRNRSNVLPSSSPSSKLGKSLLESESQYPEEEVGLCANSSNAISPHPNSCRHFLKCVGGRKTVQSCAPGTVFNPQTSVCDWETNAVQCDDHHDDDAEWTNLLPGHHRPKRSLSGSNDIISDADTNGLLSPQGLSKSNTISFRRNRRSAVPTGRRARKCQLSEEYVQPHSIYCNKFEICSNGRIVEKTCGGGTLFNPLSLVCDFPDHVDCGSRKVDFSTYGCREEDEYLAPHPETCTKFIECGSGTLQIKDCGPGTLYNREEEKCDYAFKVKCPKPISLEHDTDVNYIPRSGRSVGRNTLNLACDYNYIAPHPHICNQFVECETGRIFIKSCGPGTVFNGEIGQCDWAYNTRKPDPLDCSQYFQCERGHYTRKSCLRNTVFNPETGKCTFTEAGSAACRKPPVVIPKTPPPS